MAIRSSKCQHKMLAKARDDMKSAKEGMETETKRKLGGNGETNRASTKAKNSI